MDLTSLKILYLRNEMSIGVLQLTNLFYKKALFSHPLAGEHHLLEEEIYGQDWGLAQAPEIEQQ